MDDLISRQAAIEEVHGAIYEFFDICDDDEESPMTYKDEKLLEINKAISGRIKALPSAQPERKKPVFKTGESVYHVSYADGTGGFEKNKWADWTCPDCGWFVGEQYIPRRHNQQKCNYCARCGCAIDWSDADMRGEEV